MNEGELDPIKGAYIRELIGSRLRVLDHTDPGLIGRTGTIVDETRNMLLIEDGGKRTELMKKGGRFEIEVRTARGNAWVELNGELFMFRSEDRTKRCERTRAKRSGQVGSNGPAMKNEDDHDRKES